MTPLQAKVDSVGGLIKTAELAAFGIGRSAVAQATAAHEIERIRQGWYANPWLPAAECQAARVGGQLACSSAAAALGLWEPRVESLHVGVEPAVRHGVEVHWTGLDPTAPGRSSRRPGASSRSPRANRRRWRWWWRSRRCIGAGSAWECTLESLPRRVRRHLQRASAASESGTESIFVFRMARIAVLVRQQVVIVGVGRVDCLIVELDSVAHHSDPTADRHRDALLSARGYRVLRFMYSQVMNSWPEVEAAVVAAISRGDHLAA